MLLPLTATIATLFFSRASASNRVSTLRTGFSYFVIPCTSGWAPVNMLLKQTGVHVGMTDFISTSRGAILLTPEKSFL